MERPAPNGFSLVELAIVLAILGLLAGGIIGGQVLLRSQRVNTVLVDANKYADAMHQFREKYEYLPGDFPRATEVWGRADGGTPVTSNCAAPATDNAVTMATCNGNGNTTIDSAIESNRAWQQMALAGMINGSYSGVGAVAAGVNVPSGALDQSYYYLNNSLGTVSTSFGSAFIYYFSGDYGNAMIFSTNTTYAPVLSAGEASGIDIKADDGQPGLGMIVAFKEAALPLCTQGTSAAGEYDGTYRLSSGDQAACSLVFRSGYRNKSQL